MKKIILLLIVVSLILLSGCAKQPIQKENEYDDKFNSLIILFNNQEKEGMIAQSSSSDFMEYFKNELTNLDEELGDIKNLRIKHTYSITNGVNILFDFINNFDSSYKYKVIEDLKSELESKWYIKQVSYDLIDTIQ